jgi:hypothetical protein
VNPSRCKPRFRGRWKQYLPYEQLAREAFDTSEGSVNDAIANSIANTAF